MTLTVSLLLVVAALICAIASLIPSRYSGILLALAVILLAFNELLGAAK